MTHGSLFSGIGGFDLAAEWIGCNNLFNCEWDPFAQKILKYYWPNSEQFKDITKTNFTKYANRIDILTGGFPCQPYSTAGKRLGKKDNRHLWPHMLRAIREIKPKWIIAENVYGFVNWSEGLVFEEVQVNLEAEGYEVQSFVLPACSVNAPHKRERVWIVAHLHKILRQSMGNSQNENNKQQQKKIGGKNRSFIRLAFNGNTFAEQWQRGQKIVSQPPLVSATYGISDRLDNITFSKWVNKSNEAFGNAIVPQVAYQIFKTIQDFENIKKAANEGGQKRT